MKDFKYEVTLKLGNNDLVKSNLKNLVKNSLKRKILLNNNKLFLQKRLN